MYWALVFGGVATLSTPAQPYGERIRASRPQSFRRGFAVTLSSERGKEVSRQTVDMAADLSQPIKWQGAPNRREHPHSGALSWLLN